MFIWIAQLFSFLQHTRKTLGKQELVVLKKINTVSPGIFVLQQNAGTELLVLAHYAVCLTDQKHQKGFALNLEYIN